MADPNTLNSAFEARDAGPLARDFGVMALRHAQACMFGLLLLLAITATKLWYPIPFLHRYDFLLLFAISIQIVLLLRKWESPPEAALILLFHALAMGMEIFKTSSTIYSWHYPEAFAVGIAGVPLFVGFMYSAVGSYIARAWRLFGFQFFNYPPIGLTILFAALIYANFFTHHYIYDFRWVLAGLGIVLFGRCRVQFTVSGAARQMPLMLAWLAVAALIWAAENIGTYGHIWLYPFQVDGWKPVPLSKLSSWFLLIMVSFILVSLVHKPRMRNR